MEIVRLLRDLDGEARGRGPHQDGDDQGPKGFQRALARRRMQRNSTPAAEAYYKGGEKEDECMDARLLSPVRPVSGFKRQPGAGTLN